MSICVQYCRKMYPNDPNAPECVCEDPEYTPKDWVEYEKEKQERAKRPFPDKDNSITGENIGDDLLK